jgi:GDP-D-mannose dehydratase
MSKRALITGITGQNGSSLAERLAEPRRMMIDADIARLSGEKAPAAVSL